MLGARAPRRRGMAWRLHFESRWDTSTGIPHSTSAHWIFPFLRYRTQSWPRSCALLHGPCDSLASSQGIVFRFHFLFSGTFWRSCVWNVSILAWEISQFLEVSLPLYFSKKFINVSDTHYAVPCSFLTGTGTYVTFLLIGGSVPFFCNLFSPLMRTNYSKKSLLVIVNNLLIEFF